MNSIKTMIGLAVAAALSVTALSAVAQQYPSKPVRIVAKSPPDGYNLFLTTISTHGINPTLYSTLPFDLVKDFSPPARLAKRANST